MAGGGQLKYLLEYQVFCEIQNHFARYYINMLEVTLVAINIYKEKNINMINMKVDETWL